MQVMKGQSNNFSLVTTGTSVMNATLRYLLHLSTDTHPPKKGNQIYTQTKGKWPKGKLRKVEEGFFFASTLRGAMPQSYILLCRVVYICHRYTKVEK